MACELDILRAIGRGHPTRRFTARLDGRDKELSAVTWDEIQVAVQATMLEIAEPISHLINKGLIDSSREYPSLLGKLAGKKPITYFWITKNGEATLNSISDQKKPADDADDNDLIVEVDDKMLELGFILSKYGTAVALLSRQSGYSAAETASHLALATIARDIREEPNNLDMTLAIANQAREMLQVLKRFVEDGDMRANFFKNDGLALVKIATPGPEQHEWLNRVLSDEIVARDRVASHEINYGLPS